jgi:hypothetical protein
MPKREVDKRKTNKALRKLRRAAERAAEEGGSGLTSWEKEFVEGVTGRLEKYGSAFRDPGKGRLEDALSERQTQVARVIEKKSRKSKAAAGSGSEGDRKPDPPRSSFKRKSPMRSKTRPRWTPRVRDINDDPTPAEPETPAQKRPSLKVIPGGKGR